ncbi:MULTISPECIES: SDR family NAD(P)-dependent oxidoreductase [unclassified Achromobacter]|uniref:SDR family NAD(P)-dependent oxidoreductase n=1 Tax=unclassified Achromobacter TaxID=2626865 RepID=UPI000B518CA8|nr:MULTISPECIES: SDR family NAD(P)-dependent oxidoreductase [unclassified Achromobacter]OWT80854.1 3-hydroxyacyl-CoA dehydrogenase [Achromobacter sp. HZ34]OWT81370.1 3-hydroxyacyl-CoA dehydrogenase [Achromobacter sp. HZ28]
MHSYPEQRQAGTTPPIRLDGQVAIVTGAGGGLGRSHAIELARRGAKVVINDLGVTRDGQTQASSAAEDVVQEIRALGGEAFASVASVTDAAAVQRMVQDTMARWGRIDILVNNAGFLRDKSFSKMSLEDFETIVDVHLMGAVRCTKAVWDIMKAQNYGRIVMTTSSSGLYGNFGQANYSAAKMGLVGLMQTLAIEGAKYGIHVNCLAPSAATRMTAELFPEEELALLSPGSVTPGLVYLVAPAAPTKTILCAGAGAFACANVTHTSGIYAGDGPTAAEAIAQNAAALADRAEEYVPATGFEQPKRELLKARAARQSSRSAA